MKLLDGGIILAIIFLAIVFGATEKERALKERGEICTVEVSKYENR